MFIKYETNDGANHYSLAVVAHTVGSNKIREGGILSIVIICDFLISLRKIEKGKTLIRG